MSLNKETKKLFYTSTLDRLELGGCSTVLPSAADLTILRALVLDACARERFDSIDASNHVAIDESTSADNIEVVDSRSAKVINSSM